MGTTYPTHQTWLRMCCRPRLQVQSTWLETLHLHGQCRCHMSQVLTNQSLQPLQGCSPLQDSSWQQDPFWKTKQSLCFYQTNSSLFAVSVTFKHEAHLGETPIVKMTGVLVWNSGKYPPPPKGTKIPFCGCGFKVFSLPKGYMYQQHHINWSSLVVYFLFGSIPYKEPKKLLWTSCGPHEAEHPNRFKTSFLTPKKAPLSFLYGSPSQQEAYPYLNLSPLSISTILIWLKPAIPAQGCQK